MNVLTTLAIAMCVWWTYYKPYNNSISLSKTTWDRSTMYGSEPGGNWDLLDSTLESLMQNSDDDEAGHQITGHHQQSPEGMYIWRKGRKKSFVVPF